MAGDYSLLAIISLVVFTGMLCFLGGFIAASFFHTGASDEELQEAYDCGVADEELRQAEEAEHAPTPRDRQLMACAQCQTMMQIRQMRQRHDRHPTPFWQQVDEEIAATGKEPA